MIKFKEGDDVEFYSRVHSKDVTGNVEFAGSDNCIVVVDGVRYSLQNTQITKVQKRKK